MSNNPNKLSQFWQELKRRRVIHVITVYASAAFIVIELINNLAEPLNLPSNLLTIVVIILAVGFPLAIILSWLYDLTSKGIELTKPVQELGEGEKTVPPNAWRIATIISFVAIIGLVTFNIVFGARGLRAGDIKSMVILPVNNFTGDDKLDWVASGMHSSLIGDMGQVTGLRVLGETTSNSYKKNGLTASEIAKKDNVDVLIEPTLTCYGDMVCFQIKAITPYPEEKVLWVGDFMEDKSQILNLLNRIVSEVAYELKVNLTIQEETFLTATMTINPDAYDAYLKGKNYLDMFSPESWSLAIVNFEKAIELEPNWADPYLGLSSVAGYKKQAGFGSYSENITTIYKNLNKALELSPNSVESHNNKAGVAAWTEFDWEKSEKEFLKTIELNPSHVRSHSFYAHLLTILRRTDEALYEGKLSVELDPENPFTLGLYVVVLVNAGKCQEALYYTEKALSIDPDHPFLRGQLAWVYECLGDYDKAFVEWKKDHWERWDTITDAELLEELFHEQGVVAFYKELLRIYEDLTAKDIPVSPVLLYVKCFDLGNYDKAMDYLEIIYEANPQNPNLPYYSARDTYEKLKGNQRYLELLKKMNLPID